jgi:Fur family ferric uptake transcriptional regulator
MNTSVLIAGFAAYLRRRGLRMTGERRHILQHIFSAHTHFEVDDLHVRLRGAGHRISKATIYRTVALLEEHGVLRKAVAPPGTSSAFYELVPEPGERHEHLECEDCGQVFEVTDTAIAGHLRQIAVSMGFDLVDYSVRLSGRCAELRRTGRCSRSGLERPRAR